MNPLAVSCERSAGAKCARDHFRQSGIAGSQKMDIIHRIEPSGTTVGFKINENRPLRAGDFTHDLTGQAEGWVPGAVPHCDQDGSDAMRPGDGDE